MKKTDFLNGISGFEAEPLFVRTSECWSDALTFSNISEDCVTLLQNGKPRVIQLTEILEIGFTPASADEPYAAAVLDALRATDSDAFRIQTPWGWLENMTLHNFHAPVFCLRNASGQFTFLHGNDVLSLEIAKDTPCAPSEPELESESEPELESEPSPEPATAVQPAVALAPLDDCWNEALQDAEQAIIPQTFSPADRREEIRDHVKGTPLEKQWSRLDSMMRDAIKNHVVAVKKTELLTLLNRAFAEYPCTELQQMIGTFYDALEDYPESAQCYALAGDFENAAAVATKAGEAQLMDTLGQWILSEETCPEKAYIGFFALARQLRYGKLCHSVLSMMDLSQKSPSIQRILFLGLLAVVVNYVPATSLVMPGDPNSDEDRLEMIPKLLALLESACAYESSRDILLPKQKLVPLEQALTAEAMEQDTYSQLETLTGYILRSGKYGFIGAQPNSYTGYFFSQGNLAPQLRKYRDQLAGLQVICRLKPVHFQGKTSYNAISIQPAEDFTAFLERKGIVPYVDNGLRPDEMPLEEQEKLVHRCDDGTYSGYIIYFKGAYGFINQDPNAHKGIYFYIGDVDPHFISKSPKLVGRHVSFLLEVTEREEKTAYNAKSITAFGGVRSVLGGGLTAEPDTPSGGLAAEPDTPI